MHRVTRRPGTIVLVCLAGSLASACVLEGCRDATEIEIELSTDAKCVDVNQTTITTGRLVELETEAPDTATRACEPGSGRIGSLVIVPSGEKDGKVAVRVITGIRQTAEACIASGFKGGCIVARRSLNFLPHTSIRLPIEMTIDCLDIPCGATETCVHGLCVPAEVSDPENCTLPGGCEDAGVADAPPDSRDARSDSEGGGGSNGEAGPDTAPDTEPEPEPLPEAGPDTTDDTEPGPEPLPEAGPDTEPDTAPDTEPEPEPLPEAGPDTESDTAPDTEPEPEPLPEAGPETEPGPEPLPEAGPDTETEAADEPLADDTGPDAIPCSPGMADCDGNSLNGCEVALASDPAHCGACAHDCLGGACTASACEPVVIATGQQTPNGIATDGVNVYFTNLTNTGAVMRLPVGGGTPTAISSPQSNPFWVATDGAEVFWTAGKGSGGVYKVKVDGTGEMTLAASQPNPKGLAIDATEVFWVNQWGTLNKVARDGTGFVELQGSLTAPTFVAADVNLFTSNAGTNDTNGSIAAGSKVGGDFWFPVSGTANPMGIAADSVAMYWVSRGTGNKYLNGAVTMYVYPDAITLAGGIADGYGIAVDADWVYWTSQGDGRLERIRRDGTGRQVMASGLVAPRGVAVDSVAVYVTSSGDGRILRVAR